MVADKDWDRLAEFVRERRVELGMTQEDIRAAGGPSTATMRLIEGALQQSYHPATLRDLEKALGWERGSAADILGGGEPGELTAPIVPARQPDREEFSADDLDDESFDSEELEAIQDYSDDLRRRLARARRKYPGQPLTGALVFPRNPMYAQVWDLLTSLGWQPDGIPKSMAAMLVWRDGHSEDVSRSHVAGLRLATVT